MRLINLATVILLAGCAPTAYGPSNGLGGQGYSGRQVAEGTWEVTFKSNQATAPGYARSAALLRSAELVNAAGFPYLQILRVRATTTMIGTRGSAGNYAGETVNLKVRGSHAPDAELVCENEDGRGCGTLETARILRELEAPVRNRTPPGS